MTTPNWNRFMRTKINLKSQVLSKNTAEIVSTCIEKLYKQMPTKFKNGLQQDKIAANRKENLAPLRMLKAQESTRQQTLVKLEPRLKNPLPSNVDETLLLRTVMNNSRKRFLANPPLKKPLLKAPSYRIYTSRRYGSSASSSTASLLRRPAQEGQGTRRLNSKHALMQLKKSYSMIHGPPRKFAGGAERPKVTPITVPARNRHMHNVLGSVLKAREVSANIQRDLMVIDGLLKKRLRTDQPMKPARRLAHTKVCTYPPAPQLCQGRNEQIFANLELQQQCRRLQMVAPNQSMTVRKPLQEISQPVLGTRMKRQSRLSSAITKAETIKPNLMSTRKHQVYNNRLSLAQFQSNLATDLRSTFNAPPNLSSAASKKSATPIWGTKVQKPYKINGRIAPTCTETLTSGAILTTEQPYSRLNYAKLSTNVH